MGDSTYIETVCRGCAITRVQFFIRRVSEATQHSSIQVSVQMTQQGSRKPNWIGAATKPRPLYPAHFATPTHYLKY